MNWNRLTNEELLKYYQKGEFSAFDAFFKRNHKIVFCFLLKKVNNQEIAEDILQEVFYRVHKYILKYDPNKNAINWVLTIAYNAMVSNWRKRDGTLELPEIVDSKRLSADDQLELQKEIELLLTSLKESDRKILLDRLLDEKSFEEIGKEHKISTVNARQKVSRILKRLRAGSS